VGPEIAGLQLVGALGEFVSRRIESSCGAMLHIPGRSCDASLQATGGSRVAVRGIGKTLLGESDLIAA